MQWTKKLTLHKVRVILFGIKTSWNTLIQHSLSTNIISDITFYHTFLFANICNQYITCFYHFTFIITLITAAQLGSWTAVHSFLSAVSSPYNPFQDEAICDLAADKTRTHAYEFFRPPHDLC